MEVSRPKNFALIAPTEDVSILIRYLNSNGWSCVDHYPSLENIQDERKFPSGKYEVAIVDSNSIDCKPDESLFDSLRAVFGDCGFVFIDRKGENANLKSLGIEVIDGDSGINQILTASLRAIHQSELKN